MTPSFSGDIQMDSKTFSLGFHLRGDSLLPLGDVEISFVTAVVNDTADVVGDSILDNFSLDCCWMEDKIVVGLDGGFGL